MASDSYTLEVAASVKQYATEIAKIPGITEREVAKASLKFQDGLLRAQKEAAKAAEKAADKASEAWEAAGDGAGRVGEGAGKVAGALSAITPAGGDAARALADAADAAEAATVAAKAAGVSVATLGAALGAVAVVGLGGYLLLRDLEEQSKALKREVDAGAEALERMKDALDDIASLEKDLDLRELRLADPQAAVHLEAARKAAEKYAPLRAEVAASIGKERDALVEAERALADWNEEASLYAPDVAKRRTDELTAAVEDHRAAITPLETQLTDLTEAQGKLAGRLVVVAGLEDQAKEIKKQSAKATRDQAAALREAEAALAAYAARLQAEEAAGAAQRSRYDAAIAKLGELAEADRQAVLTGEERLTAEHEAALQKIDDLKREALAVAETATARENAEAEANAAILAEDARYYAERDKARKADAQRTQDAAMATAVSVTSAVQAVADAVGAIAEAGTEQQKKLALVAFRVSQGAAIASTIITTASAAMKAYAAALELGPPGLVLAPIAAGAAAATGAAQVATIAAQEPPKFHSGGFVRASRFPDEVPSILQDGEAVLSRQGRAALGDETIRRANRGEGGTERPVVVVQQYRHRVFDSFVSDSMRMPTSSLRRAVRAGRRVGHRRRDA